MSFKRESMGRLIILGLMLVLALTLLAGCGSQDSGTTPEPKESSQDAAATPEPQEDTQESSGTLSIPHPLEGRENCLACHKDGIGGAPKTSHPERAQCTTCHKPAN